MQQPTIAVDLAKSVFEVAISQHGGRAAKRHRLSRRQFARFMRETEPATFVMEACGTSHFWAAVRNEAIRPVPVKSVDPHVIGSLHRLRSTWMATRTDAIEHAARAVARARFGDPCGRAPGDAVRARAGVRCGVGIARC
jgi:transposase